MKCRCTKSHILEPTAEQSQQWCSEKQVRRGSPHLSLLQATELGAAGCGLQLSSQLLVSYSSLCSNKSTAHPPISAGVNTTHNSEDHVKLFIFHLVRMTQQLTQFLTKTFQQVSWLVFRGNGEIIVQKKST